MMLSCSRIFSRTPLLMAAALAVILGACTKNEVRLTFELPKDVNTPCRILYYDPGKRADMISETVAEITAGKGEMTLPLHGTALIYLFSPSQRVPLTLIYAHRGEKFTVTGSGGAVEDWAVAGNAVTEELTQWRLDNLTLLRNRERQPDPLDRAVARYVEANPASESSAIMLWHYFVRRGHEKEFYRLQGVLGREVVEKEELMTALSAPDMMTGLPDKTAIPREMVMVGDSGYADTLRLAKGDGWLLIFRASADRGVSPDSVKALLRRSGKDKGMKVAELYMETDSLSWRRYLRKDTLREMKRLWMPLGVADTAAIRMGVRRTPYFMVLGPKGREVYRGDSWDDAVKKFEGLKR